MAFDLELRAPSQSFNLILNASASIQPSSSLGIGVGMTRQKIYSSQPSTGVLTTWDTNCIVNSVDVGTNNLNAPLHGHLGAGTVSSDGPFYLTTTGTLPTPLTTTDPYYTIYVDANTLKLATSMQNSAAGTAVDLTSTGTGGFVINRTITTQDVGSAILVSIARGVWSTEGTVPKDNKGNNFTELDQTFSYASFPGSKVQERWDLSAVGGTSHVVSGAFGDLGGSGDEVTISILEVTGAAYIVDYGHVERAIGTTVVTTTTMSSTNEAIFVVRLWGNGPVGQDHIWRPENPLWLKHTASSCEADTHPNGYIQLATFYRYFSTPQTNITGAFLGTNSEGAQVFWYVLQATTASFTTTSNTNMTLLGVC